MVDFLYWKVLNFEKSTSSEQSITTEREEHPESTKTISINPITRFIISFYLLYIPQEQLEFCSFFCLPMLC